MNRKLLVLIIILIIVILLLTSSSVIYSSFEKSLVQKVAAKTKSGVYRLNENEAKLLSDTANRYGFKPEWLANLINYETAGTFSPTIRNPTTGATGLIQFMPATAKGLGTTTDALRNMSFTQQWFYVDKYLSTKKGIKTQTDLFMAVFYPVSIGNPNYQFPNLVVQSNNGINTPLEYTRRALANKLF